MCIRDSSRLNPVNWFGTSTVSAPVDANGNLRPLVAPGAGTQIVDGRSPVDTVTSLRIDPGADGGTIVATGTAAAGAFNAQLVPVDQTGGTLTLAFRTERANAGGGTQTITAARQLSAQELVGVRRVVVQAARNTASTSR